MESTFLRRAASSQSEKPVAEPKTLLFESDDFFHSLYDTGMHVSGTPDRGPKRRARFFNLMQALESTYGLPGDVIECGCWKGLSSYLTCNYIRRKEPSFVGKGFTVVDSFEGLSEPTAEDSIEQDLIADGIDRKGKPFKRSGAYSAPVENVARVLAEFPAVSFVKGWIPQVLYSLPATQYRFVHVDLDFYAPTLGALEYFYPRLVLGGVIVCDDYGSVFWPGAKRAVEVFCEQTGTRLLANASGQGFIFKF
jgi:O-methyltransferase